MKFWDNFWKIKNVNIRKYVTRQFPTEDIDSIQGKDRLVWELLKAMNTCSGNENSPLFSFKVEATNHAPKFEKSISDFELQASGADWEVMPALEY